MREMHSVPDPDYPHLVFLVVPDVDPALIGIRAYDKDSDTQRNKIMEHKNGKDHGNSEIGAHVRSNICFFICLKYLITG